MAKQTHTSLRDAIVVMLNATGIKAWANETTGVYDPKIGRYRTNKKRLHGVSDILGCLKDGQFVAIEVKLGKDTCSEAQTHFLQAITERGGIAFVARSKEAVIERLNLDVTVI